MNLSDSIIWVNSSDQLRLFP